MQMTKKLAAGSCYYQQTVIYDASTFQSGDDFWTADYSAANAYVICGCRMSRQVSLEQRMQSARSRKVWHKVCEGLRTEEEQMRRYVVFFVVIFWLSVRVRFRCRVFLHTVYTVTTLVMVSLLLSRQTLKLLQHSWSSWNAWLDSVLYLLSLCFSGWR